MLDHKAEGHTLEGVAGRHMAAVKLDDAFGDGQAQAGTFAAACGVCPVEGIPQHFTRSCSRLMTMLRLRMRQTSREYSFGVRLISFPPAKTFRVDSITEIPTASSRSAVLRLPRLRRMRAVSLAYSTDMEKGLVT